MFVGMMAWGLVLGGWRVGVAGGFGWEEKVGNGLCEVVEGEV